jgi:hypothetical protein
MLLLYSPDTILEHEAQGGELVTYDTNFYLADQLGRSTRGVEDGGLCRMAGPFTKMEWQPVAS